MRNRQAAGLACACLLLVAPRATARDGAPDWLERQAARALPAPAGADAIVLLDRTECRLGPGLRVRIRMLRAVRVLTARGRDAATLAFTVETGLASRSLRAWTLGAAGGREEAPASAVAQVGAGGETITDVHTVMIRARGGDIGDVVGAECLLEGTLPFATLLWSPRRDDAPVDHAEYALELPDGWSADAAGIPVALSETAPSGRMRTWTWGPFDHIPDERAAPPVAALMPRAYIQVRPASASRRTWDDVAAWTHGVCEPRWARDAGVDDLLARADTRAGAGAAGMDTLARLVQRAIRYEAIELGMRGWIPDRASDTWTRRYGDCKDKAVVMVAGLRALGIEAVTALACTRDRGEVRPEMADGYQFDHEIVALRWPGGSPPPRATVADARGERWTLFDPTDPSTPLGDLPTALAGTRVLLARPGGGLLQLPAAPLARAILRARLRIGGAETDTFEAVLTCGGPWGHRLAWALGTGTVEERRTALARFVTRGTAPSALALRSWSVDAAAGTTEARFTLPVSEVARAAGDGWLVTPPWTMSRRTPPPADSTRVLPFELGGPVESDDELRIEVPAGYRVEGPALRPFGGDLGDYELTLSGPAVGVSVLHRRALMRPHRAPADRRRDVQALLRSAYVGDGTMWRVTRE